jgi:hypothetical protein
MSNLQQSEINVDIEPSEGIEKSSHIASVKSGKGAKKLYESLLGVTETSDPLSLKEFFLLILNLIPVI